MASWDIEWTPEEGSVATFWHVYYSVDDEPPEYLGGTNVNSYIANGIPKARKSVRFFVVPVVNGVESVRDDWSETTVNLSTSLNTDVTAPDNIVNFRVVQSGDDLVATWDASAHEDIDHYELRYGGSTSTWNTAGKLEKIKHPTTRAVFGWRYSGDVRIHIRAVLKSGRVGGSVFAELNVRDSNYFVTEETNDESSGSFSGGTMTNVEYSGAHTALQPTALPALWSDWTDAYTSYTHPWWYDYIPGGDYETPTKDAGAIVEEKIEVDAPPTVTNEDTDYTEWRGQLDPEFDDTQNSAPARTEGARNVYDYVDKDGNAEDGNSTEIQINISDDNITWSGWYPWIPGAIYRYRYVKLRIVFNLWWPFMLFRIGTFTWKRKRQNRKDEKQVTVSALGGTAVTWDTVFTKAPKVVATVEDAAQPMVATVESITTSGCDIKVFDMGGTERSTATVSVVAAGV